MRQKHSKYGHVLTNSKEKKKVNFGSANAYANKRKVSLAKVNLKEEYKENEKR